MNKKRGCLNFKHLLLQPRTASRARCTGMDAISLPRRKEMAKEKTPRRSPLDPPTSRRFTTNGGDFALVKFLHLGRISARPRWVC